MEWKRARAYRGVEEDFSGKESVVLIEVSLVKDKQKFDTFVHRLDGMGNSTILGEKFAECNRWRKDLRREEPNITSFQIVDKCLAVFVDSLLMVRDCRWH